MSSAPDAGGSGMPINTIINSSYPVGSVYSHNGPVCNICGRGYIGPHQCSIIDLQNKIDFLQQMIVALSTPKQIKQGFDPSTCPCSPTRGGSGICGCTLGGLHFTNTI